jgi:methionyl-tRNA formyltransferase
VAARALAAELPLLRPERVGEPEVADALRALAPDLGVVVAFGQFLPKRIRQLPSLGYLINGHASLLPRHRGAAPIAHAVLAGDRESGISVMRVEREMDAGAVALTRSTPIGPDDTAGSLERRLADLCAEAVAQVVDQIANERVQWTEQDHARATLSPKLGPDDALLDWRRPASELWQQVRGLDPRPGARTTLAGEVLRIWAVHPESGPPDSDPPDAPRGSDPPGTLRRDGDRVRVATGAGWLVLDRLQRAGGRALPTAEFLRGRDLPDGARLGEPAGEGA